MRVVATGTGRFGVAGAHPSLTGDSGNRRGVGASRERGWTRRENPPTFNTVPPEAPPVTDDDLEAAVETFLDAADTTAEEYEKGYMDADAAMNVMESHVDALREAYEEET